ncbi:MAG: hypothetical protein ACXVZ4_00655 [Gaiellaceae bacterium]
MRGTVVALLVAGAFGLLPARASACKTLVVRAGSSIQAAVDRAAPCDWVLIAPGVYHERVWIRTPHLHLRGLDRNTVVIDGRHRAGNGIEVDKADDVWIENLTVRNFDLGPDHEDGNQVWFNGGDESGVVGASGWHGNYLTAYHTGLHGSYGLFTSNSVHGEFDHVYASGFGDSGLYIGACRDCYATVSHAVIERNAVGYSGTNAGGHLVVQDSVFRDNATGIAPNSLPGDPPPPQLGTCDSGQNATPTPMLTTTRLQRCTIFRRNTVTGNNNRTTPVNATTAQAMWGVGIAPSGVYGDLFSDNTVTGNANFGVYAFELPFPFPPTDKTIYFQLQGNRFERNRISGSRVDIAFTGGLFGQKASVNNCFAGNVYRTSQPADLGPWSCANETTPNPPTEVAQVLAGQVLLYARGTANQRPQPAPPPQPTMPHPCGGVPANPLCR